MRAKTSWCRRWARYPVSCGNFSGITDEVYPSLNDLVNREPGFTSHLVGIEPQLAFAGANIPLLLKGWPVSATKGPTA